MAAISSTPPPGGRRQDRQLQGAIYVPPMQAEFLFGKLGTHSTVAGAVLELRDPFESNRLGRRVLVQAPTREVAAAALSALLFQLCYHFKVPTTLTKTSWFYYGDEDKDNKCGPFEINKLVKWGQEEQLAGGLLVQDVRTNCWVPLWYLLVETRRGDGAMGEPESTVPGGVVEGGDVAMEDVEQLVAELNSQRAGGMLQVGEVQGALSDFPELTEAGAAAAEPMDYELSVVGGFVLAPEGARVYVVVDTNVLMSHMAFVERVFDGFMGAGLEARKEGKAAVEVQLVVPWVVLCELDKLKGSSRRAQSEAARHALYRLRALTTERDTYVKAQPAAEHFRAVRGVPLPPSGPQLRNDDMILQTCMLYQLTFVQDMRRRGQAAEAFLLSNDNGLVLRAQTNGVPCFTAREFPKDSAELAKKVPASEAGAAAPSLQLQQLANHQPQSPILSSPGRQPSVESLHSAQHSPVAHLGMQSHGSAEAEQFAAAQAQQQQQQQQAQQQAQAAHAHMQAQAQAQQLTESMRLLQMRAQQAQHAQHTQQAQQQQAQSAQQAEQQAQHQQQLQQQLLQRAQQMAAEQEAALSLVAQSMGHSLDALLRTIAQQYGLVPEQMMVERLHAFAGGPVSPELRRALQMMQGLQEQAEQLAQQQQQQGDGQAAAQAAALQAAQQQQQAAAMQATAQQHAAAHATAQQHASAHVAAQQHATAHMAAQQAAAAQAAAQQQQLQQQQQAMETARSQNEAFAAQLASLAPEQQLALQQLLMQGQVQAAAAGLQQHAASAAAAAAAGLQRPSSTDLPREGSGGQRRMPQQGMGQQMHAMGRPEAAAAALLAARQLEASGSNAGELMEALGDIIADDMAPIVKYHRQQDQGDMWLDLLDDRQRPPWDAHGVINFINGHPGTFFWGTLEDGMKRDVRNLEHFLRRCRGGRGPPSELSAVAAAARDTLGLLRQFQATAHKPRADGANPDPASIEGFVSLGEATAALDRGLARCSIIVQRLGLSGGGGSGALTPLHSLASM